MSRWEKAGIIMAICLAGIAVVLVIISGEMIVNGGF